jgi:hypothetical protein
MCAIRFFKFENKYFLEDSLPKKATLNLLWEDETHLGLKPGIYYLRYITATEHLFSTQDCCRLNQLHSYLIGQSTSESTSPPALHALLEAQQAAIIKHFQQIQAEFKLKLTQTLQDTIKDTVTAALCSQAPPPVPRMGRASTGSSACQQNLGPQIAQNK